MIYSRNKSKEAIKSLPSTSPLANNFIPLISLSFFALVSEENTALPFDTLCQRTHDNWFGFLHSLLLTGGPSDGPPNPYNSLAPPGSWGYHSGCIFLDMLWPHETRKAKSVFPTPTRPSCPQPNSHTCSSKSQTCSGASMLLPLTAFLPSTPCSMTFRTLCSIWECSNPAF